MPARYLLSLNSRKLRWKLHRINVKFLQTKLSYTHTHNCVYRVLQGAAVTLFLPAALRSTPLLREMFLHHLIALNEISPHLLHVQINFQIPSKCCDKLGSAGKVSRPPSISLSASRPPCQTHSCACCACTLWYLQFIARETRVPRIYAWTIFVTTNYNARIAPCHTYHNSQGAKWHAGEISMDNGFWQALSIND